MKKNTFFLTMILVMVLSVTTFASEGKGLNLLTSVGVSADDYRGAMIGVGIESQVAGGFYIQGLFDVHLKPIKYYSDFKLYDVSLLGAYKFKNNGSGKFFIRGGLHYATLSYSGDWGSDSDSRLGLTCGAGWEQPIGAKTMFVIGTDARFLFPEDETITWFKIYAGLNFKLK